MSHPEHSILGIHRVERDKREERPLKEKGKRVEGKQVIRKGVPFILK